MYSYGEKQIADFLYKSGIKYEYETPIRLGGIFYNPDFYLPDHAIYIEYLGMISDPEYAYQTQLKKIAYHEHKLDVIYIIPQHLGYLGAIINQWIDYKSGRIPITQYIRLCKESVPKPPIKVGAESRRVQIARSSGNAQYIWGYKSISSFLGYALLGIFMLCLTVIFSPFILLFLLVIAIFQTGTNSLIVTSHHQTKTHAFKKRTYRYKKNNYRRSSYPRAKDYRGLRGGWGI